MEVTVIYVDSTSGIYTYFYFESVGYSIVFVNILFSQASRNYCVPRVYSKI